MKIVYQLDGEKMSEAIYDDPVGHLETLELVDELKISDKYYMVKRRIYSLDSHEIVIHLEEVSI